MTQEHTPEPWIIRRGDWSTHATLITTAKRRRNKTVPIAEVDTDGFNKEFGDEQKANARRIVACVNACAGWETSQLEAMELGSLKESLVRVMQQCDDLLAAEKDHRRLVRELDVLLNGEAGAAQQASLCDLVAQVAKAAKAKGGSVITKNTGETK